MGHQAAAVMAKGMVGPVPKKLIKRAREPKLKDPGIAASKVTMATSPLVLAMTATLEECNKPGMSNKLAPYIIKELEQGLVDANCAKEAWEAVILRVASPPTDSHLDEEQIVERCKTWQNTVDNAKVMIGIAKSHDA